jgi:hypothetical protein
MEKYLELDKKIMVKIGDNPVPFSLLFVRDSDIANECEKLPAKRERRKNRTGFLIDACKRCAKLG